MTPYHDGYHRAQQSPQFFCLPRFELLPLSGRSRFSRAGTSGCTWFRRLRKGASTLNSTHISLPISLLMLVVRKASNSVRGPVFHCLLVSRVSHYGHMADSVAPCATRPGLRGSPGWPLAAFNTRTGDSFRRPIRCCRYWWRFVRALYRILKLECFCCRTWWIRGCH
jgi:hypothetical protein